MGSARREAEFWDGKILKWEHSRYANFSALNPFAWTVRSRFSLARKVLRSFLKPGTSVLDLGCGSGLLGLSLRDIPGIQYHGIDISPKAIEAARQRQIGPSFRFEVADVRELKELSADVVVFLGLLDWVSPRDLAGPLKQARFARYLFSFTEENTAWNGSPYQLYRRWFDPKEIRARSFSESEIYGLLNELDAKPCEIYRNRGMGPGRVVLAESVSRSKITSAETSEPLQATAVFSPGPSP